MIEGEHAVITAGMVAGTGTGRRRDRARGRRKWASTVAWQQAVRIEASAGGESPMTASSFAEFVET